MKHEINDLVVVVPGFMGSSLHRHGKPIWEASRGPVVEALITHFRGIKELCLPRGIGDEPADDGVTAAALIPDIRLPLGLWTFDLGYTRLLDFLADTFELNADPARGAVNLIAFPYDWRLSNRLNGKRLQSVAEPALERWRARGGKYRGARIVFICHSMGGLVARWYVDCLGGVEHTRSVITLGTPHRGAVKALDTLVNGVPRGPRSLRLVLSELARSLPSAHQLLPEYACIERDGSLFKTTELAVADLDGTMASDAMQFHKQLAGGRGSSKARYELYPIGGHEQRTLTTARMLGSKLECVHEIGGSDERGDGTVPRLSFTPPDLAPATASAHYAADNHAGLIHNQAVFDQIEGILTARAIVHRAAPLRLSVEVPESLDPGEALTVRASVCQGKDAPLEVVVANPAGEPLDYPVRLLPAGDALQARLPRPAPGVHQVTIRGAGADGSQVSPITSVLLVWPQEGELAI